MLSENAIDANDLAVMIGADELNNCKDEADVEFYLIHHLDQRIEVDGKRFWHQNFNTGRGITPTFTFVEE